jgi:hypothetical protein
MSKTLAVIPLERIHQTIYLLRGEKVMLDRDLAALYGVTTGNLNKAVKRNTQRFPADFMFQLIVSEVTVLSFQIGSLKRGHHFDYCFRRSRLAGPGRPVPQKRAKSTC